MSKMLSAILLFAILFCSLPSAVFAQGNSSSGTDFWVGFMPNFIGGRNVTQLFLASGTKNTVKVSVNGATTTYQLNPNDAITADLNGQGVVRVPETPSKAGVHVTSTAPLTMYGYNVWDGGAGFIGGSPDGFLAIPTSALGTKYYTVNHYDATFAGQKTCGEYLVLATRDNTTVTITTKAHTRNNSGGVSHNPGDTWSFSLMKGEAYLVQSTGDYIGEEDLTGSLVSSDKPVALLSGHQISPITVEMTSADHLLEMVPPVDKWGTQYFDMPMAGRTKCGDYLRIISGEDGNQITYNGNGPFFLNAGEWVELPTVTVAEVMTSINKKKFMVAQYSYSQGYNGDPGMADPFMILMTPQEQFEKRMLFRTPRAAANGTFVNYLTVIAPLDSLYSIRINGKGITSFGAVGQQTFAGTTNPVMASIRVKLSSGAETYLATANVPFGMYQYGFSLYEGYGWPTGMALNVVSSDTLPPLETRFESCGRYDVVYREVRHMPEFSFEDTRIAAVDLITEQSDPRWNKPSFNYTLALDPAFEFGDSLAKFSLFVSDLTKSAYAAVYTVDRAGNDTIYEYTYSPPTIKLDPIAGYDFGSILIGTDSCKTITLTNTSTNNVDVISFAQHLAQVGKFTLTPDILTHTLKPGEQVTMRLCFTAEDTGSVNAALDSLDVKLNCATLRYPLTGEGVTPLILAKDLNFGIVDSGNTLCKDLRIDNPGTYPLTITKQDLLNTADFSVDATQPFPVIIKPGEFAIIKYCFHPTHTGTFITTALFTTLNPQKYLHSIKDTSVLRGQSFGRTALLTSYELTSLATCDTKPLILDTVYDPLSSQELIDSVSLTGVDVSSFKILGFSPGNGTYPVVLAPKPDIGVTYTIQFDPTVKGIFSGPRTAELNVYGHSGEILIATITADSKAPAMQITPGTVIDLGSILINQTTTAGTFTVKNTGNDVLNIKSVIPTAGGFTVTPQGSYTLAPGASQVESVTYTATTATGDFLTDIVVTPQGSNCVTPQIAQSKVTVNSTGVDTTIPIFGTIFTCKQDALSATFTNRGSKAITYQSATVTNAGTWLDAGDFQLGTPAPSPVAVGPGEVVTIPIIFKPSAKGRRDAGLEIRYLTSDGVPETMLGHLIGTGDNIQEVVGAGSVITPVTYQGHAGDPVSVPIVLDPPFQNRTNEVFGYTFDVTWLQDAFQYGTVSGPAGVTITRTGSIVDPATHMETSSFKATSVNPLTSETTIATLALEVMLNTGNASTVVPSSVKFLDKNEQEICYITTSGVNSNFNFQPNCGDASVRTALLGDVTPLSLIIPKPNPFTSHITLDYEVRRAGSHISLVVFDAMGNQVEELANVVNAKAGEYQVTLNAGTHPAGVYFIRLSDGSYTTTRSVVLKK